MIGPGFEAFLFVLFWELGVIILNYCPLGIIFLYSTLFKSDIFLSA